MDNACKQPIYLDHNATTPVAREVLEAMMPYLRGEFGNPSSAHIYGRSARRAVDRARRQVAQLIGASPSEVVFTSGGTESNNLAIVGSCDPAEQTRLVTSAIEHPSVVRPCQHLEARGMDVTAVKVDGNGQVDAQRAVDAIDDSTRLVTIMHANNETGTIQPLEPIVEAARKVGAVVHTDAAQSIGKIDIDVDDLAVDLLTIAGHKVYAPKGVGVLYVRRGVELSPVLQGAGHERGLRPGTENVASIVGIGEACRRATEDQGRQQRRRVEKLRDLLWERLNDEIDGLQLNGHPEQRLPNTLNVAFPGVEATELLARTPEIAASTGSACKEGGAAPSPVLKAMGLNDATALGSIRLSLGCGNDAEQIEKAARLLGDAWRASVDDPDQPVATG